MSGLRTTARELQTCTFEGPDASNNNQNATQGPPREEERNKIVAGEGKKKREILGLPPFLALRSSTLGEAPPNPKMNWPNQDGQSRSLGEEGVRKGVEREGREEGVFES